MADNRKRAPRGGKQAASGSRPIRRNDRAAAPKGQRDRTQAARPQRDRNRDNVQAPKGEFIEGRRAMALPRALRSRLAPSPMPLSPTSSTARAPVRRSSSCSTM